MFYRLLLVVLFPLPALAEAAAEKPSFLMNMIPFVGMFFIFYFLLIRPQVKKQKTHESLLMGLKKGDQILTSGGLLGKIEGVTEKFVTLEISDKVKVRLLKAQVAGLVNEREK